MAKGITEQFKVCLGNINSYVDDYAEKQMVEFAQYMVNNILPSQQEFRNLTGNTKISYAFGFYLNGALKVIGFNKDFKPPLRNKLVKGEELRNFIDYDGDTRVYFKAEVDTDAGYGQASSATFLSSYKPNGRYSLVFTTGTEYSAYLENILNLNVLSDGFEYVGQHIITSFKPIK